MRTHLLLQRALSFVFFENHDGVPRNVRLTHMKLRDVAVLSLYNIEEEHFNAIPVKEVISPFVKILTDQHTASASIS